MQKIQLPSPGNFLNIAVSCMLAAIVLGLLTAMTLAGIVLLLSSYTH